MMASRTTKQTLAKWRKAARALFLAACVVVPGTAFGQRPPEYSRSAADKKLERPSEVVLMKESSLIEEVIEPELIFHLDPLRSKIIRTRMPISRVAITDPQVVEINEFSPNEIEIIGLKSGETTVTLWFEDNAGGVRRLRYLVKVGANEAEQQAAATEFQRLQNRINELFPNSQVQLIPVADKLVIRGEARDAKEASEILALVMGQAANRAVNSNAGNASLGMVNNGQGLILPGLPNFKVRAVLNMMRVPGEHQVMLKVRIAELSRTALRELGSTYGTDLGNWGVEVANLTGSAGNISAILNQGDYHLFVNAFASNGYGKILAEPTLVTLNGQPAMFMAGGEFAVPTTVGVQGASAVATTFRGFGTMLSFLPVVTDKDKIRLTVSPSFSTRNAENTVNGIPGLNTRAVTTTVDLREGQWLAIAGMILDQQEGNRGRIPFIGDIPGVGAMFGNQRKKRDETELVVLVSPELVHPLEKDQAPLLLPGMEVTDPTDVAFFFTQQWEGMPGTDHRSTLWPQAKHQEVLSTWQSHHTRRKTSRKFADDQAFFVSGPSGLSK